MKNRKVYLLTVLFVFSGFVVNAETLLRLGVFPFYDFKTMLRMFAPVASLLEEDLGITVELVSAENRKEFNKRTENGNYDLVWTCPACYLKVHESAGFNAIARGVPPFKGVVMVRKDSGIESISDLKGKKVAAVSPYSIAGYLFFRNKLMDEGLIPQKDVTIEFVNLPESIPFKVYNGSYDAGVFSEDTLLRSQLLDSVRKSMKVILTSIPIPQPPFAVKKSMDKGTAKKIQESLLSINDIDKFAGILSELNLKGIEAADDRSYNGFRVLYSKVQHYNIKLSEKKE